MASVNTFVIKRQGNRPTELFRNNKLHRSILLSCLAVRTPEGEATSIASYVTDEVERWLINKPEVTSDDIRVKASQIFKIYHPEAAHLYKHHHLIA